MEVQSIKEQNCTPNSRSMNMNDPDRLIKGSWYVVKKTISSQSQLKDSWRLKLPLKIRHLTT